MKKIILKSAIAALPFVLASCSSSMEKFTENLSGKNLTGNGTFISSRVGINESTKVPELKTVFISGDVASTRSGTNAVSYREESSSSIWNAKSVTKKRFLSITLSNKEDVAKAISAAGEILKYTE